MWSWENTEVKPTERKRRWDWTEQEEPPLGTQHITLYPQANGCSRLPPSKYSLRNSNASVVFQVILPQLHGNLWKFNEIDGSLHQASLQSDKQPFGSAVLHSWIIWLKDGVLVTEWGDGAWPRQVSFGSHTSSLLMTFVRP